VVFENGREVGGGDQHLIMLIDDNGHLTKNFGMVAERNRHDDGAAGSIELGFRVLDGVRRHR